MTRRSRISSSVGASAANVLRLNQKDMTREMRRENMFAAQDPSSVMVITLVIAVAALFFWRTMIKLAAIGTIMLVVLGFIDLLRGLH